MFWQNWDGYLELSCMTWDVTWDLLWQTRDLTWTWLDRLETKIETCSDRSELTWKKWPGRVFTYLRLDLRHALTDWGLGMDLTSMTWDLTWNLIWHNWDLIWTSFERSDLDTKDLNTDFVDTNVVLIFSILQTNLTLNMSTNQGRGHRVLSPGQSGLVVTVWRRSEGSGWPLGPAPFARQTAGPQSRQGTLLPPTPADDKSRHSRQNLQM